MTGKRKRTSSLSPNSGRSRSKKGNHNSLPKLHSNCTGDENSVKQFKRKLQARTAQYSQEDLDFAIVDAVKRRHEECVKPLLDAGASINARCEFSRSLLCLASYDHRPGGQGVLQVNSKIIEHLVLAGINANELFWENYGNFSLFVILALKGLQYYDLVELLLSHGGNVNSIGTTPNPFGEKIIRNLTIIALRAEPVYTKLFLEHGADPNGLSFTPDIFRAIRPVFPPICGVILLGKLQTLKYLLLYNAKTDILNLSPHFHDDSLLHLVVLATRVTLKTKVKIFEMLRKFGCRMWALKHFIDDEEFPHVDVDLSVFYRKPLSLLEHSRIAVLHAMGGKYVSNIHSLQIPTSLQSYLEFNDVNTEVEELKSN